MTKLDHHSTLRCVSAVLFLLLTATFSPAQQETVETKEPGEQDQQEQKADAPMAFLPSWVKERVAKIQQRDGPPQGFAPSFGDIKRGSGFAPGVAYAHSLSSGGVVVLKGAYSINNYKMVQMAAQSAPVAGRRLIFRSRARWQDAPSVRLYALGSDSPDVRTAYAETKTEVSGETAWTPASFVRVLAGVGLEQFDTGFVHNGDSAGLLLFSGLPGAATDPRYVHGQVSAAIDLRDSPGYGRRGSLLSTTFHNFHQTTGGPFTFQRVDAVAEQYIPIVPDKWVVYLNLHVATTMTDPGHEVPFFLLPDLGGHDLRGFSDYRFRDRHAINWTAEYRWYALEFLDAAIFYDAGKVVSTRSALDFEGLTSSVGGGIRLHSPRTTYLRLELAHGREGLRFVIAFSPVGQ